MIILSCYLKEVYSGEIHQNYILTNILSRLPADSLESKIVKTLSLFYALYQFERLRPTKDEIVGAYSSSYTLPEITEAIEKLIERDFVIYIKRSNDFLKLMYLELTLGRKIRDYVESHAKKTSVKEILNASNYDNYMYPSRYNDEREMTDISPLYLLMREVRNDKLGYKSENIDADGIIYAIPHSEESINNLKAILLETAQDVSAKFLFCRITISK